ncbi:MAG: hypothetical protein J1F65_00750 [Clostridiales bacterium]|nr:hypothetical protein [Clostridiales bacterium]
MLDIIILIACALCGYACGKYLEKRIKRKGEFYSDLNRYVALLKVNVEGRQVELSTFDSEFTTNCSPTFREYLQNRKWKCSLTAAQKSEVSSFFDNMDCVSSQQLRKHIDYYATLFETSKQTVEKEVTKSSIYVKLGILLGVMVGIVLM